MFMEKSRTERGVEPRIVVNKMVNFRPWGERRWRIARSRNISRSGLLFACNDPLEIGSVVEVSLGDDKSNADLHCGRVVRRVLMAWPEVEVLIAISFVKCDRWELWETKAS